MLVTKLERELVHLKNDQVYNQVYNSKCTNLGYQVLETPSGGDPS